MLPVDNMDMASRDKPPGISGRLRHYFGTVATDPGFGYAAGNHVLAWAVAGTAGTAGTAFSGAALALVAGFRLSEAAGKAAPFNTLYITAAGNLLTGAAAFYSGVMAGGDTLAGLFSAAALTFWAGAHVMLARRAARNGAHGPFFTNPFLYGLAGNLSSVQVNGLQPIPSCLVACAALRSLTGRTDPAAPAGTVRQFFVKHVTPVRLTSAAFAAGAVIALVAGEPLYAAAQAIWTYAAFNLDKDHNRALVRDIAAIRPQPS